MLRYLLACLFSLALAVPASAAGFVGPGTDKSPLATPEAAHRGYDGNYKAVHVSEAITLPDDTHVVLEGNIVEKTRGKNRYLFRDESGTILVKIKDKKFNGQEVTPQTPVRIFGEVEQPSSRPPKADGAYQGPRRADGASSARRPPKIDVDRLEIIK